MMNAKATILSIIKVLLMPLIVFLLFLYDNFHYYRGESSNKSIGDQKEIWYNPDNHSKSSFYKPGPDLYPYVPFIFAIPIMLAAYHVQAKKENKSLR